MANKKLEYPKIHLGESFVDQQAQKMFGTSDLKTLNKKQMKKLDAYLTSDEGRSAAAVFRQNDHKKFKDSLDQWKLVSAHNSSIDQAAWRDYINKKYPLTQTIAGAGSAGAGSVAGGGNTEVVQTDPVQTTVVAKAKQDPDWEALATQHGFTSLDDVKAFQKKVGLEQTGQLDEPSLAKLAWYNHMKQLGYTEGSDQNGHSWFSNNNIVYYNNGRQQASDGTMSNYDYTTLTNQPRSTSSNTNQQLLAQAKQLGFNSIDELKAFQAKVGLVADGNITDDLKSKHAWYNHMKGLGFKEGQDQNGQSWFSYGTNTYYNNGKVKLGNGSFSDYDYKTLSKNIDYNTSTWRPHNYFRFHYDGTRQVTLPDGTFPVYVVRSGTVGNNNKWNLVEDESYAYDPASGKVRRLQENMFGMVQDQGDLKTPKWVEGEDWIDISTLPSRRSGGLLSTRKLYFNKQGGTMNRIKYFQQGGPAQQQQGAQDVQQQVVALVQAAIQGDEKATQTVNQIMEAAKKGDQQAVQLAQMIQAVVQQMEGQATSAKWGSKLNYIRSLKYAKGGKACPACAKGAPIKVEEKACGGKAKKAKKRYFGGWL